MSSDKDYQGWKCDTCGWIWDRPWCEECQKSLGIEHLGHIRIHRLG